MNEVTLLQRIGKYRDAIMGFAILWIMLFHSGLNLPGVLFAVKRVGCVGVDVFLFLSGFGCAHSFDKDRDTAAFYIRRCKRLYPHYIPVLLIFIILKLDYEGAVGYLRCIFGNITGISYWSTGGLSFNWYIPAIIVLYFIFPILYFIIRKRGRNGFMILFVISVAVGLFYGPDTNLSLSITRFPSFVMGVAAGVHLLEQTKRKSSDRSPVMVLPSWVVIKIYMILSGVSGTIMFICLFVLSGSLPRTFFNLYNALFLITPTVLFVSSGWFSRLDNRNYGKYVIKFLEYTGRISLDIYLVHIVLFEYWGNFFEGFYDFENMHPFSIRNTVLWLGAAIVVWLMSYLYNIVITWVTDKFITLQGTGSNKGVF